MRLRAPHLPPCFPPPLPPLCPLALHVHRPCLYRSRNHPEHVHSVAVLALTRRRLDPNTLRIALLSVWRRQRSGHSTAGCSSSMFGGTPGTIGMRDWWEVRFEAVSIGSFLSLEPTCNNSSDLPSRPIHHLSTARTESFKPLGVSREHRSMSPTLGFSPR